MKDYSKKFYRTIETGSQYGAEQIIPLLLQFIQPKSVVDVGCGIGTWLSVFKKKGIGDIIGIDGDYVDRTMLHIPDENFLTSDLEKPVILNRKFDLVISVEVGEHLPSDRAPVYVKSLVDLGPVILFSAAIPYQGGTQHINEQWPDYWMELFGKHRYVVVDAIRKRIWNDDRIDWWYRQNMLLFVEKEYLRKNKLLKEEHQNTCVEQICLVHPALYSIHMKGLTKPQHLIYILKQSLKAKFKSG